MGWSSFWDIATPDQMAKELGEQYGADAKTACHINILHAKSDNRMQDYQFWLAVLCRLYGISPNRTLH